MNYHIAGYYLIKIKPLDFGSFRDLIVLSCSSCLNNSLLDSFARSWICKDLDCAPYDFKLNPEEVSKIHKWTQQNDADERIGFIDIFYSIEAAREYRKTFFSHLDNVKLFGLYLPESESSRLIEDLEQLNNGTDGIRKRLMKLEPESNQGTDIGYDLIGVECGGSFHSFHCHDLANELKRLFNIELNEFGLIKSEKSWTYLVNYMNDEKNGCESVPWYFAKVKLIDS